MSKIIRIFLIFFSLKIKSLGADFLIKWFFSNFNFKTTFSLKSDLIFDEAARLGKTIQDAYSQGTLLF